jgi:Tfp pilus assembly protein PilN
MPDSDTIRHILSIGLTPKTVDALLLRSDGRSTELLHRFVRPRRQSSDAMTDMSGALPGLQTRESVDFTLEVGGRKQQSELQVDPTLQNFGVGEGGDGLPSDGPDGMSSTPHAPVSFAGVLRDILGQCQEKGIDDLEIVFCAGPPDVGHVELVGSSDADTRPGRRFSWEGIQHMLPFGGDASERASRITSLRRTYAGPFDRSRVTFYPMTPTETGVERHLAIFPTADDSITPTLKALFAGEEELPVHVRRFDAEIPIYVDIIQHYLSPEPDHTTAVVRVTSDDTLILFVTGTELRHVERLRSLTSYDAADTIASRVLLYQDEQKIGQIDAVLLANGPTDKRLTESFRSFYPDAAVGRLHEILAREWVGGSESVMQTLAPESGLALAAALRIVDEEAPPDTEHNLIGDFQSKPRTIPSFAWHTALMLVLLTVSTLFFVWRYVDQQNDIDQLRTRVAANPIALPDISPERLQERVDSLNAVHGQYARSLYVLDSLLYGSTEWSATLARIAEQTGEIEGIWLEDWQLDEETITLRGNALDRNRIASFARNLDGTVHTLTYADIDAKRVYPFEISIPRRIQMPEAAMHLREQSLDPQASNSGPLAGTTTP